MNKYWDKKSEEKIKEIVFDALSKNINYDEKNIIGVPASYLDQTVFNQDASFLKDAPFLSTLIKNPNHIGCHTLGASESFFAGTHEIEKDLIKICAHDILGGDDESKFDGYVASGGTEANLQAIWIYRNYFMQEKGLKHNEICILTSSDNHYSMDKAGNVFSLPIQKVQVTEEGRFITEESVQEAVSIQKEKGVKAFIVVANMMTTMFGSIDEPEFYSTVLEREELDYFIHVDGAYGGFYFPFSQREHHLDFRNPKISSVTLDAHKMAQAPYGTGIFVIRENLMQYANTKEASYVEGEDSTLIGSRSGANAVAVWMILTKYGPYGWMEKIFILQKRTAWMCEQLNALKIEFYRHPSSNIITIKNEFVKPEIAKKYGLVPDNHHNPKWNKIVIMDHVTIERLSELIEDLKK
ncbi:pyridoxal phosphate-dependent decarboxylase family protein [Brumimicrobium aurantiacum]|uniref:Aspartate aminotransferase family protein n=1 Tax=Brumimicrobium aurantiacum TaxID=1737063 RepID=A0A3E1F1E4_9FLAO|nr:pyridoxal-dependent decarboxylase [Brumimicrobium aurantiacum]RFC55630.1 aspartate aminotransferase family protein [Brumimicrobium aurantiacum]